MLTVTCPGCDRDTDIPDSAANRQFECPHCETVVDIPRTRKKTTPAKKKPAPASGRANADDFADEMTASAKKSKKLTFACLSCGRTVVARSSGGDVECPRCGEEHSYKEALRENQDRVEQRARAEKYATLIPWYITGGTLVVGLLISLVVLFSPSSVGLGFFGVFLTMGAYVALSFIFIGRDAKSGEGMQWSSVVMCAVWALLPFLLIYTLWRGVRYPQLWVALLAAAMTLGVSIRANEKNMANKPKDMGWPAQPNPQQLDPPQPVVPGQPPQPVPPPVPPKPALPPPGEVPDASGMPGLMGYWRFDEGEGETARDAVNGAVGTLHGAKWVPGIRGKALAFDGKTDWFDFGKSLELNIPNESAFTAACWVKSSAQSGPVFEFKGPQKGVLCIALNGGKLLAQVRRDAGRLPADLISPNAFSPDVWHHVAISRGSGGRVELFQDGVSVTSTLSPFTRGGITTNSRSLGWDRRGNERDRHALHQAAYLNGAIDEFVLFERALSAAEIAKLAGR